MPKRRFTAEQKRQLIEEQARSGQTLAAFCADRGIGLSTLSRWKRLLNASDASLATDAQAHSDALFTPLVAAAGESADEADDKPVNDWAVELDLGNGMCLRIRRSP